MFFLKKLASRLLFPVPLSLELLLLGVWLLWFTKHQKAGKLLVTVGTLLLALLSHAAVGNLLLAPLEHQSPAWQAPAPGSGAPAAGQPKRVVVLGAGYCADPRFPITGRPNRVEVVRLVEGVRVCRDLPGSRLVLSVGYPVPPDDESETMVQLAVTLGVRREEIDLVQGARDTEEELVAVERLFGADPFVLVTSGSHMPRALALARARGLTAIPAPTDHAARGLRWDQVTDYFPDADGLYRSERACYEYLGLAWTKLCGRKL